MIQIIKTPKQLAREARNSRICALYTEAKRQYPNSPEKPIFDAIGKEVGCSSENVRNVLLRIGLYVQQRKTVKI